MKTTIHTDKNGQPIAAVFSETPIISNAQDALDFLMSTQHETGSSRIALNKQALIPDFFILSSGIAGEVLQKCSNYRMKLAIWGDYSHYTSKPLKDFIYESNRGETVFFTATQEEAIERLSAV